MAAPPPLIPPDFWQCQAEITEALGFMRMGGPPKTTERCKNRAAELVTETKAGKDGRKGQMTLCTDCLKVCTAQVPNVSHRALTLRELAQGRDTAIAAICDQMDNWDAETLMESAKQMRRSILEKMDYDSLKIVYHADVKGD